MGELEEKLENILGNPQAMAQIMSLAQSLNLGGVGQGGGGQSPAQGQPQTEGQPQAQNQPQTPQGGETSPAPPSPPPPPSAPTDPGGGLAGMLGGLDPGTLSAAASLIGQFTDGGGDDKRTALLTALRPFVREERYAKLDKAIQIAKMSRLIRSGLDLFRARRGDGHV